MARFPDSAVCSPLTLASEIGHRFLAEGGNAVDAAVATNLALAVAYPHMCGVGGDLLAMVWADGRPTGLNSSGRLPAAAVLPEDGVPVRGIASATVPGAVAGWLALVERWGTIPVSELAAPAIELARSGFAPSSSLRRYQDKHASEPFLDDETARTFLDGSRVVQRDLAETLAHLDDFYRGRPALNAPPPFTPQDFAAHDVAWVEPLMQSFGDVEVCEMPPNSRGHLALEALARLEPLDGLTPADREWHARILRAFEPAADAGDTVYLCCVDRDGLAVSLNQSLYMDFGSGVMIPGTGVVLHNRGAYFTEHSYGPRAQPIHTLAPAMVLREGEPLLVLGTMGGEAQVQIHVQLLARILIAQEDVESAIAAPRWNYTRSELIVDEGLPDLEGLVPGVTVRRPVRPEETGHAHCIRLEAGSLSAAADPRSDGMPVGS